MVKHARVSFITATRNAVKECRTEALRRCVSSVASVRIPHEHIIIDGASDDGTVLLLERLRNETPFMTFISEPDHGIYDALNKGVRLSCGDWVHILGCDDWICDAKALSLVLDEAEKCAQSPELVVTHVDRNDGLNTINMKSCLFSIPYCHQGLLTRRIVFEKVNGFDANFRLLSDYKFSLSCLFMNLPHKISKYKFAHYEIGGASSDWSRAFVEGATIMQSFFGLTKAEEELARDKHVLPLRVCVRYLFHRNKYIRLSAAYSFAKRIAVGLGVGK